VQTLASHLRLLPERDAHRELYETFAVVLDHLEEAEVAGELMVRFELALLNELGFGLDLTRCAATGSVTDLVYVSPKSGRAVSREGGEPWSDRLLPLPSFLLASSSAETRTAQLDVIQDGFRLTGHFLDRDVYVPRGERAPSERGSFIDALGMVLKV